MLDAAATGRRIHTDVGVLPAPRSSDAAHTVALWWLNPGVAIVCTAIPALIVALALSSTYYERAWRTPKWVSSDTAFLVVPALVAIVIGVVLGGSLVRRRQSGDAPWPVLAPSTGEMLRRCYSILVAVSLAAYGLWALVLLARGITPATIIELTRSGDVYDSTIRERFQGIAGLTTLTQVGPAAVTVGAILCVQQPSRYVRRTLLLLFIITGVRSYLFSERLALIELVVPLVVVLAAAAVARSSTARRRRLMRLAPLIAIPALVTVFALFEFSRSWSYYSVRTNESYTSFVSDRMVGYYATSYNNGQLIYEHYQWPEKLPYYSMEFIWSFPVLDKIFSFDEMTAPRADDARTTTGQILSQYGNPEFNSPNGIISPSVDFGVAGGVFFLGLAGVVLGGAYQSFRRGRIVGLLLYPSLFTGVLELPRELYWTLGRNLPTFLALALVLAAVGRSARRAVAPSNGRRRTPTGGRIV